MIENVFWIYIPLLFIYFSLRHMNDLFKRISISVISWWFLGYVAYLLFQNIIIVQSWFIEYNMIYYIILLLICLFLFILFGIYPVHFKMTKATLLLFVIAYIVICDSVLLYDIAHHVYVADIFKVLWVVLTLLAWTNVLITDKVKKQKQSKKVEIIEV